MSDEICLGYRGQEESGFDTTWSKSTINRNTSTDLKEFRRKTETAILVLNKYRRSYAHSRGYLCSRGYLRTMRCTCAISCNSYTLAQYVRPHVDPITQRHNERRAHSRRAVCMFLSRLVSSKSPSIKARRPVCSAFISSRCISTKCCSIFRQ